MKNNKKILLSVFCLLIVLLSSFGMSACKKKSKIKKYDINFIVEGETYDTINTSGNIALDFPIDPTKTGYEFAGWYLDNDIWNTPFTSTSYENQSLTADLSVYAKFDIKKYKINYQNTNGAINNNETEFTITTSTITLNDISLDGYEFLGWFDALTNGNKVSTIPTGSVENKTLYARWSLSSFAIKYENIEGLETSNPSTYTIETENITLLNPTKEKYIFAGWYDSQSGGNQIKTIPSGSTGDKTLYARWIDYILTISYDTNKLSVRDSDEITSELFNATCIDNDDSTTEEIIVTASYEGTLVAGNTINVILTSTSNGVTKTERIENILVKETPNITSKAYKHLYTDDNLSLLFDCTYYNTSLPATYEIASGEMKEGKTVVINAIVTDDCGIYKEAFTYDVIWSKRGLFTYSESTITGLSTLGKGKNYKLVIPYEIDGILITKIGEYAFNENNVIKYLETPTTLREIARNAFTNNTRLSEINFSEGLEIIGGQVFIKTSISKITFPNSLIRIEAADFQHCTNLKHVVIPENVSYLGYGVFLGCTALESVEFKNPDTELDVGSAFYQCTSLSQVKLPENLKELPRYTFYGCSGLYQIDLPKTLETIGASAFEKCSSLRSIYISLSITTLGASALSASSNVIVVCESNEELPGWAKYSYASGAGYVYFGADKTRYLNDGMVEYYVANSGNVRIIKVSHELTEYEFPETIEINGVTYPVVEIGTESFANTPNLRKLVLPSFVHGIEDNAFGGCPQLILYFEHASYKEVGVGGYWRGDAKAIYGYSEEKFYFDGTFEYMIDTNSLVWITALADGIGKVEVPNTVTFGGVTHDIYDISNNVFRGRKDLFSVYIPSKYNTSDNMFAGCDNVVLYSQGVFSNTQGRTYYFNVNDKNYYYDGTFEYLIRSNQAIVVNFRLGVTDLVIPSSITLNDVVYPVTQLGTDLFKNRNYPLTVTLPTSITTIQERAFENCEGITNITLNEGLTLIEEYAFVGCKNLESVILPSTLEEIERFAFSNCTSLEFINFDSKITSIATHAFEYCGFKTLTIPTNIETIQGGAFSNCNELEEVYIPNTVRSIGVYGISSLKAIVYIDRLSSECGWNSWVNSNTKVIYDYKNAFTYHDGTFLFEIKDEKAIVVSGDIEASILNIPSSIEIEGIDYPVVEIGNEAFCHYPNLVIANIPEGVKKIGDDAFSFSYNEQTSLIRVNLPESVTEIGKNAFYNCAKLEEIDLPSKLEILGDSAFYSTGIKEITIPSTLTKIPYSAFYSCEKLTEIIIPSTVTEIGYFAFNVSYVKLTIYCYADGPLEGWDEEWYRNNGNIEVIFNYTGKEETE